MVNASAVETLRKALRGHVVGPDSPDYDQARCVYNGSIDRRPGLVVSCANAADVASALLFAVDNDLELAVRGGGHSGPGFGTMDDGLVVDLSSMRGVRVDPTMRTVRAEGGATWGDVDHATYKFGLALPSGVISTTGVGGLTLGGGHGHLTRRFGLSIDSLLAADMVLADGSFVTVTEENHPDLFWAIRGGGGNFGVVTSFLFQLHSVKQVVAGPTFWPAEAAGDALRWYRSFLPAAPETLNGFFMFMQIPAAPTFPEELHGMRLPGVFWCFCGKVADAEELLEPVAEPAQPLLHALSEMPYPALQSAFDALYPPGDHWYWRGDFFREMPDAAVDAHADYGPRLPTAKCGMHLYPIDGAVHRVASDATAFAHRDAVWSQVIVGVDPDAVRAREAAAWTQSYWEATHPYSEGAGYVNFLMGEGDDRVRAAYGANYARLAAIKARYDPTNLFRSNHNVVPSS